jgi:Rad52/22 family double-strand break repair protein
MSIEYFRSFLIAVSLHRLLSLSVVPCCSVYMCMCLHLVSASCICVCILCLCLCPHLNQIDSNHGKGWVAGAYCVMRVTLKNGAYHEDVGYGNAITKSNGSTSKSDTISKARKQSFSDARKRAVRVFGRKTGGSINDKSIRRKLRSGASTRIVILAQDQDEDEPMCYETDDSDSSSAAASSSAMPSAARYMSPHRTKSVARTTAPVPSPSPSPSPMKTQSLAVQPNNQTVRHQTPPVAALTPKQVQAQKAKQEWEQRQKMKQAQARASGQTLSLAPTSVRPSVQVPAQTPAHAPAQPLVPTPAPAKLPSQPPSIPHQAKVPVQQSATSHNHHTKSSAGGSVSAHSSLYNRVKPTQAPVAEQVSTNPKPPPTGANKRKATAVPTVSSNVPNKRPALSSVADPAANSSSHRKLFPPPTDCRPTGAIPAPAPVPIPAPAPAPGHTLGRTSTITPPGPAPITHTPPAGTTPSPSSSSSSSAPLAIHDISDITPDMLI